MRGNAERVDLALFHIDIQVSRGLCRVHREEDAVFACNLRRFVDGKHRAADVGCVRQHHQFRIRTNQTFCCFQIEIVLFRERNAIKRNAVLQQLRKRAHHAVVFQRTDQHMITGVQQPLEHHVEGVGLSRREDHMRRVA